MALHTVTGYDESVHFQKNALMEQELKFHSFFFGLFLLQTWTCANVQF